MAIPSPEGCIYKATSGQCRVFETEGLHPRVTWIDTARGPDGRVINVNWRQIQVCMGEDRGCVRFIPIANLNR